MKKFLIRLLRMSAYVAIIGMISKLFGKLVDFLFEITNNSGDLVWIIIMGGVVLIVAILWSVFDWYIARKSNEVENEN